MVYLSAYFSLRTDFNKHRHKNIKNVYIAIGVTREEQGWAMLIHCSLLPTLKQSSFIFYFYSAKLFADCIHRKY